MCYESEHTRCLFRWIFAKVKSSAINFRDSASRKNFELPLINIWWLVLQLFLFPECSPVSMRRCSLSLLKSSIRGDCHLFYAGPVAEQTGFGWGKHQGHLNVNWKDQVETLGKGKLAAVQQTQRAWVDVKKKARDGQKTNATRCFNITWVISSNFHLTALSCNFNTKKLCQCLPFLTALLQRRI